MWIKYHYKEQFIYQYKECEEISMNFKDIILYKNKEKYSVIDLEEIDFFYISNDDPRERRP